MDKILDCNVDLHIHSYASDGEWSAGGGLLSRLIDMA